MKSHGPFKIKESSFFIQILNEFPIKNLKKVILDAINHEKTKLKIKTSIFR
jgi:hypothetical protein